MNKIFLFVFIMVLVSLTISAEDIGTFKINEKMQITNYCNSGVCSYVNLQSLEFPNGTIIYPNISMTQNGQIFNYSFIPLDFGTYNFVTCGYSTQEVCDSDSFFVNFNGEKNSILTMMTLLLFFIGLFLGYYHLNSKINYDRWYDGILRKYENRNYVKLGLSSVGYNLIKNKVSSYYLLGFPIVLILVDLVLSNNIVSLVTLFKNLIFIYSLGIIMVAFLLLGQAQEFIRKVIDDSVKYQWGITG